MEVYFGNLTTERGHADKMAKDVETLVQNAEELVQTATEKLSAHDRHRLEETLARLKESAAQFKQQAMKGFRATDRVIREYPYQSTGLALCLGVLVGVLAGRPGSDE